MEAKVQIEVVPVGPLEVNCCVLRLGDAAIVVDPGADEELIEDTLQGAKLEAILLTHAHYDHIGAVNELLEAHPGCRLLCHAECDALARSPQNNFSEMIAGMPYAVEGQAEYLEDGQELEIAGIRLRTFLVPGHMPGQLCYYCAQGEFLCSGDTVFASSIGRSDFPGGDGPLLVQKITAMLAALPGDTVVYPGHGPATTVERERSSNPYLC